MVYNDIQRRNATSTFIDKKRTRRLLNWTKTFKSKLNAAYKKPQ